MIGGSILTAQKLRDFTVSMIKMLLKPQPTVLPVVLVVLVETVVVVLNPTMEQEEGVKKRFLM